MELDLFDYFGIAWYSKEFYCEECYLQVEFGCAGLQGYEDFAHNKWTMQYQSDLLKKVIKCVFAEDGFCGTFVWHFADIRTNIDINRARGFNNKGILNEYRRPKTSYFTVKELYE